VGHLAQVPASGRQPVLVGEGGGERGDGAFVVVDVGSRILKVVDELDELLLDIG
jgi:hypothetical protein